MSFIYHLPVIHVTFACYEQESVLFEVIEMRNIVL